MLLRRRRNLVPRRVRVEREMRNRVPWLRRRRRRRRQQQRGRVRQGRRMPLRVGVVLQRRLRKGRMERQHRVQRRMGRVQGRLVMRNQMG